MRKDNSKAVLMGLVVSFVMALVVKAEALEPRLLWKKELISVLSLGFAKESGDVIVSSVYEREILLFDKQGNTIFHWGPRIDRAPYEVSISADGKYFIHGSGWTESFMKQMKKEDQDEKIHYVQRNGKEIWLKIPPGYSWHIFSPDGKYIAFGGMMGEGGDIELWDSTGKRLWVHSWPNVDSFKFSPDSKYLVADLGGGVELIDLTGNTVFERQGGGGVITSVANDANYIATFEYGSVIFDKQGNIVLQGGKDDITLVSGDGSRGILWSKDGVKVYSLPDKTLIKTYPIKVESRQTYFYPADISFNGRYLVLTGSKISPPSTNNIFVIDLVEDKVWETKINNPEDVEIYLTNNGQYLLIKSGEEKEDAKSILYYYQIF